MRGSLSTEVCMLLPPHLTPWPHPALGMGHVTARCTCLAARGWLDVMWMRCLQWGEEPETHKDEDSNGGASEASETIQ